MRPKVSTEGEREDRLNGRCNAGRSQALESKKRSGIPEPEKKEGTKTVLQSVVASRTDRQGNDKEVCALEA